jgi:hypothetical protein
MAQDPAQPPPGGRRGGGQGRFGGGQGRFGAFGQMTLVNAPLDVLTKELKLTDDQKTAITAARTKNQEDMRALMQPGADGQRPNFQELQPKMQEISQKGVKDIEAILKDDQKAAAPGLLKDLTTLQTLRIPIQTYSDLKLTSEQKTKLNAVSADIAKDRAAKQQELQTAAQAGDQAKVQEIRQSMFGNGQPNEKALAVLTSDQKDLVTKYIKDHPAGQGGGRRFGPGAGAGAGAQR